MQHNNPLTVMGVLSLVLCVSVCEREGELCLSVCVCLCLCVCDCLLTCLSVCQWLCVGCGCKCMCRLASLHVRTFSISCSKEALRVGRRHRGQSDTEGHRPLGKAGSPSRC